MDNKNDWNRAKSPVFWGALCSLIAAEIVKLADNFSWWNLALAVWLVCDFHGADRYLDQALRQPQALDGSLNFFVDRLPELVVALPDDHGRAVRLADDLIHDLDGSL